MDTIYLHFHIGCGGRFNNAGHITFQGEESLQDVIRKSSDFLFECNRDSKGRFMKKVLKDCSGHTVCETPDAMTGILEFDGSYDTDIVMSLEELEEELSYDGWNYYYVLQNYINAGHAVPSEVFDFVKSRESY